MKKTKFNLSKADVTLFENFFTQKESSQLFNSLSQNVSWQQRHINMFGKRIPIPRSTAWYGDAGKTYEYSGIALEPNTWNSDLLLIKKRIEKEVGREFNSCLLNYYKSGKDSVSWHQDNEPELGVNPLIASVSLGDERMFQLRPKPANGVTKTDIPLKDGSLLLMKGTTQHHWEHQIPKTAKAVGPRINLTFRII